MKRLAVVAFGGNALLKAGEEGTIEQQEKNSRYTSERLLLLLKNNYNLVITHGNGPQVGNILLANNAGHKHFGLPDMPLDICVAYSQGFIGYMIEQQLRNVLRAHEMDRDIISIITQVLVTKDDPAFQNPTKPIGPYYTKEEADKIASISDSKFAEDPQGRGYRKVVASPKPLVISNVDTIRKISREGQIVIAVGGGGIPSYYAAENELRGIDAVIDKDLASALLASQINADKFFILTDVSKVYLNFNTPQQKAIDRMSVAQARRYLAEGQFTEGSMAPKVRAAIHFVEHTGKDTIITSSDKLGVDLGGTRVAIV
ncbi:MAG: carbamate kinase [Bacteroidetes bacterium]|nr:carbamate kinase [Bacteroidota bacterium]MCK5765796.1 carbamate kinase [Bacteroidales bacterium]